MIQRSNRRSTNPALTLLALALAALLFATSSTAQMIHYSGKFVCGFELGNVRLLNDPTVFDGMYNPDAYEDLKPGNYATAFNILNASLNDVGVFAFVTVPNTTVGSQFIMSLPIPSFNAAKVSCEEIVQRLGPRFPLPFDGTAFEGFLTLFTAEANLKVDVVYTFESQNAFERHVFWGYDPFVPVAPLFENRSDELGDLSTPLAGSNLRLPNNNGTASGAGGLGLGVSIDVESIDPGVVSNPDGSAKLNGKMLSALREIPELRELLP